MNININLNNSRSNENLSSLVRTPSQSKQLAQGIKFFPSLSPTQKSNNFYLKPRAKTLLGPKKVESEATKDINSATELDDHEDSKPRELPILPNIKKLLEKKIILSGERKKSKKKKTSETSMEFKIKKAYSFTGKYVKLKI